MRIYLIISLILLTNCLPTRTKPTLEIDPPSEGPDETDCTFLNQDCFEDPGPIVNPFEELKSTNLYIFRETKESYNFVPKLSDDNVNGYTKIGSFKIYQEIPEKSKSDEYQPIYSCYSYKRSHWISKDENCTTRFSANHEDDNKLCEDFTDEEWRDTPCIKKAERLGYIRKTKDSKTPTELFTCQSVLKNFRAQKVVDDYKYCDQKYTNRVSLGWVEDYNVKNKVRIYIHENNGLTDFVTTKLMQSQNGRKNVGGFDLYKDKENNSEFNTLYNCFAMKRSHWVSNGDCKLSYNKNITPREDCSKWSDAKLMGAPCITPGNIIGYSKKTKKHPTEKEIFNCRANNYEVTEQKIVSDKNKCPKDTTPVSLGFVEAFKVKYTDPGIADHFTVVQHRFLALATANKEEKISLGSTKDQICFLSEVGFSGIHEPDRTSGCRVYKDNENGTETYKLQIQRKNLVGTEPQVHCQAVCLKWDPKNKNVRIEDTINPKKIRATYGTFDLPDSGTFEKVSDTWRLNDHNVVQSKNFEIKDAISGQKNICGLQELWLNDLDEIHFFYGNNERAGCNIIKGDVNKNELDKWLVKIDIMKTDGCYSCDHSVACSAKCVEVIKPESFETKIFKRDLNKDTKFEELFDTPEEAENHFCHLAGFTAEHIGTRYARCQITYRGSNWLFIRHANATDELKGSCRVFCHKFPSKLKFKYYKPETKTYEDINI